MAAGFAFVLNLDADVELGSPRGEGYTPTNAVREAIATQASALAATLLQPGDLLVDEGSSEGVAAGRVGRAFCPTPRALRILRRAGATPERSPPLSVLREVNGRGFSASLGQTLPGASFVQDLESARAILARTPAVGAAWRVKRAFGMAGRGQRVIPPGELADADADFVRQRIADGVQIEPNVPLVRELGLHGRLGEDGSLVLGRVVEQRCDARGQWQSTTLADAVDRSVREAFVAEAQAVAEALHRRGYFGPFGIDGFLFRAVDGESQLCPRSEINARYSMGYGIGFGSS
jgi:hypothetical protein